MAIHWTIKISAFIASVVTLSWFFAGWRQVNESGMIGDWALLLGGTLSTVALVLLQSYWIYFEEKEKGSLKKRVEIFERIHDTIEQKVSSRKMSAKKSLNEALERGGEQ